MKKINIKNEKIIAALAALTLIILTSSAYASQLLVWYITGSQIMGGATIGGGCTVVAAILNSVKGTITLKLAIAIGATGFGLAIAAG